MNECKSLLGGATGRVGDPSGKSSERPVLDDATIAANVVEPGRSCLPPRHRMTSNSMKQCSRSDDEASNFCQARQRCKPRQSFIATS